MKYRAFLPALALLLLTACGKAELTGITLQPVTVQARGTTETAVQYKTVGNASDAAIQAVVDANRWTWLYLYPGSLYVKRFPRGVLPRHGGGIRNKFYKTKGDAPVEGIPLNVPCGTFNIPLLYQKQLP